MVRVESRWGEVATWRKVLAVLSFSGSAMLALGLVWMFVEETQVRDEGVRVVGEVVGLDRNHRSPDYADVRFRTVDGDVVVADIELVAQGNVTQVGDRIELAYDSADPAGTAVVAEVQAGWYWLNIVIWLPILVAIPLVLGGAAGGLSIRRT